MPITYWVLIKSFVYIISFNSYNNPVKLVFWPPINRHRAVGFEVNLHLSFEVFAQASDMQGTV